MISRLRTCGALAVLLVLLPVAAAAQPHNPFADLFGRAPQRTGKSYTTVDFRSEAGVQMGWTTREALQAAAVTVPDGLGGSAAASLDGRVMRDRIQLTGQGRYRYDEYREDTPYGAPTLDANATAHYQPTTRLQIDGGVRYDRSPYYRRYGSAPDAGGIWQPIDPGAILLADNDSIEGSAGVVSNYTKRSSLTLSAYVRDTSFANQPLNSFKVSGAEARWRRQLNRDFALHAGYGQEDFRQTTAGVETRYINELIDVGVDYSKGLALGRRTALSFSTGSSMLRENGGPRKVRINGHIGTVTQFLRSWELQLGAQRETEFLAGFFAPVFTDRASVSLSGYLATRLVLNVNTAAGRGESASAHATQFVTYTGQARLSVALTRHLGLFTQYVYYRDQLPSNQIVIFNASHAAARQSVSFGVNAWAALIEKGKVPRDTR